MIHPRGAILDVLKRAGIDDRQLHDVARQLEAVYEQVNDDGGGRPTNPFEGADPDRLRRLAKR